MTDIGESSSKVLGEYSAQEQTDFARLNSRSGVWALSAGSSGRIGRRTSNLFALGIGTGVAVLIVVIVVLTTLIGDRSRPRSTAADAGPGGTPTLSTTPVAGVVPGPAVSSRQSPQSPRASQVPQAPRSPRSPQAPPAPAKKTDKPDANPAHTIADFEHGTAGWTLTDAAGTVVSTSSWASAGERSLQARIDARAGATAYLNTRTGVTLPERGTLRAVVRSGQDNSVAVKLYVKSGPDWTWTDGGTVRLSNQSTTLMVKLTSVTQLDDVREIGLQILVPAKEGDASVFIDAITVS